MSTTTDQRNWIPTTVGFLGGQIVSMLGSSLVQYAIMWYITLTTESGVALTLSIVFGMLPQAIVSIFGGVWADRLNRKALVIGADASIAVATAGLALLYINGIKDLWIIFAVLAIRSTGAGIQSPAVAAILPQIVPEKNLLRVNSLNGSAQSVIQLVAPAIAAWLYATQEMSTIFLVDVGTAAVGIGILALLAIPRPTPAEKVGYFDDLARGLKYTWTHKVVRRVLVYYAVVFLLVVPTSYLTPLMAKRTFDQGGPGLAALEIGFSVGMILGGLILAAWGGLKNRMTLIGIASIILGLLSIGLGASVNFPMFIACMALTGLAVPFFSTTSWTLMQETVEAEMQGRVFGLVGIVITLAMPVGMVVFGPLADVVSVEILLIIAGVLTGICGLIAVRLPSPAGSHREDGQADADLASAEVSDTP